MICKGLAGDDNDAATIGAFVIRMLSCTTNGLCQDLKVDALGSAFDKAVGQKLTGDDCLIDKKSEMTVAIVFIVCILVFTFIGYMLGKKMGTPPPII